MGAERSTLSRAVWSGDHLLPSSCSTRVGMVASSLRSGPNLPPLCPPHTKSLPSALTAAAWLSEAEMSIARRAEPSDNLT